MSLIDYIIWGLVLVLSITLFFYSFNLYRKFKNQAKEKFKNRFSEKKLLKILVVQNYKSVGLYVYLIRCIFWIELI